MEEAVAKVLATLRAPGLWLLVVSAVYCVVIVSYNQVPWMLWPPPVQVVAYAWPGVAGLSIVYFVVVNAAAGIATLIRAVAARRAGQDAPELSVDPGAGPPPAGAAPADLELDDPAA